MTQNFSQYVRHYIKLKSKLLEQEIGFYDSICIACLCHSSYLEDGPDNWMFSGLRHKSLYSQAKGI